MRPLGRFHKVVESPFGHGEEGPRQPSVRVGRVSTGFCYFVQQSLVARCSAIVGLVPLVGGLFSQLSTPRFGRAPGWQRDASSFLSSSSWTLCCLDERALLRSQGAPLAALPFSAMLVSPLQRFDSDIFRVLYLGRLSLPLPLPCHHRASRALAGVLGRRGHALEFVAARVCREEGARVLSTNVFLLDLDLIGICVQDQRRIEVIVEGLPVFHGAQLAITLLSPLRADGNLTNGVHGLMVQLWWLPDAARSGHIQSWWETVNVSSWLCLLGFPRQGEDPLHSRAVAHSCSLCLGCSDGGLFWHVLQPGRLHLRCWIVGATREHTAPPRRMLKFWLISARRHQLWRCQGLF